MHIYIYVNRTSQEELYKTVSLHNVPHWLMPHWLYTSLVDVRLNGCVVVVCVLYARDECAPRGGESEHANHNPLAT
jgi:hypothetical protein